MKAKRQTEVVFNSATMLDGFGGHVTIISALLEAEDLRPILVKLDADTRNAIRLDALFHLADLVLHKDVSGPDFGFYQDVLTALVDLPQTEKAEVPRQRQPVLIDALFRVPDVAKKIGMSEDWTRRYFEKVDGIKLVKSPKKRGKREYAILLIPQSVLERELRKLTTSGRQ